MRISDLRIQRFLGWQDVRLPLTKKINLFVGPNDVGKSSIVDAVEILLTGQARGYAEKETPLMARGAKGFRVSANVGNRDGLPIELADDAASVISVTRTATTVSPKQPALDVFMGDRRAFLASLHVGRWLTMPKGERQSLVWDCVRLDTKALAQKVYEIAVSDREKMRIMVKGVEDGALRDCLAFAESFRKDYATQARRDLPIVSDNEEATAKGPIRRSALPNSAQLRSALETAVKNLADAIQDAKTPASVLAGKMSAQLEGLKERAATTGVLAKRAGADWDKVEKEAQSLDTEIHATEVFLASHRSAFARWKAIEALLGGSEELELCPCCTHKMDDDERMALATRLVEAKKESARAESDGKALASKLTDLRARRAKHEERFQAWESNTKASTELQVEIDALAQRLKETEEIAKKAPKADLVALERRTKVGQALLEARVVYETEAKARADAERACGVATAEATAWSRVEEILRSPADADVMTAALARVRASCAKVSPILFYGDEKGVDLTDDWEPSIMGRDIRGASKSERARAAAILGFALAELGATRLLVLDDVEGMDGETRASLTKFLETVEAQFDTIILLMTQDDRSSVLGRSSPISQIWWCGKDGVQEVKA